MSRSYSYFSRLKGRPRRIRSSVDKPRQVSLRHHHKVTTSEDAILQPDALPPLAAVGPTAEF
jgi:hypothetical protein